MADHVLSLLRIICSPSTVDHISTPKDYLSFGNGSTLKDRSLFPLPLLLTSSIPGRDREEQSSRRA